MPVLPHAARITLIAALPLLLDLSARAQGGHAIEASDGIPAALVTTAVAAPTPAGVVPYDTRLQYVREIAARFPGRVEPAGHQYRELGLMAGIFMQTQWQHLSGRDRLPIWYLVNASLTVAPRAYMDEYIASPDQPCSLSRYVRDHPTRGGDGAPIQQVETCQAWKTYFQSSEDATRDVESSNLLRRMRGAEMKLMTVTHELWKAHTTSIRFALWQYRDELVTAPIAEPELAFWRGWVRTVFLNGRLVRQRPI